MAPEEQPEAMGPESMQEVAGVREGQVLAGKYRVERVLGVGGMGAVVAAYHVQLDMRVAIKFLLPAVLQSREAIVRFDQEARRAVKITSDHVARVFDVGALENGAPYMVMEYLQGSDLGAFLRERGPLPFDEAVDFVLQGMEAIAEAHALGIVHRDLKPANLFCIRGADGKPFIKVLDFGISKALSPGSGPTRHGMTATAAIMGSPYYMSPEQMESSVAVDARTDTWALGVILFELLTGQVPFPGQGLPEICSRIITRPPPPLREHRPDAPEELQTVITTCLEKDRERRYRTVAELAMAIAPFGSRRAKVSAERIVDILQAAGLAASTASVLNTREWPGGPAPRVETIPPLGTTTPGAEHGASKGAWVAAGASLALFAAVAGAFVLRSRAHRAGDTGTTGEDGGRACESNAKRCAGSAPEVCNDGKWVTGAVAEGQCGAVCTPAVSHARCDGLVVETCGPTGQWLKGDACPFACAEGACRGECAAGATRCAAAAEVQTCSADWQWGAGVACDKSNVCRDGACAATVAPASAGAGPGTAPQRPAPSPSPARAARADCDPNYTVDPETGAHKFKPWCFR